MFELFNEIFENFDSLRNSLSVLLKYKFCFYAICYIILFIAHFDSVIKKLNTNSFLDHNLRILKMSFKILPLLYLIIFYLYLSSPFSSHLLSPSTLPLYHPPLPPHLKFIANYFYLFSRLLPLYPPLLLYPLRHPLFTSTITITNLVSFRLSADKVCTSIPTTSLHHTSVKLIFNTFSNTVLKISNSVFSNIGFFIQILILLSPAVNSKESTMNHPLQPLQPRPLMQITISSSRGFILI